MAGRSAGSGSEGGGGDSRGGRHRRRFLSRPSSVVLFALTLAACPVVRCPFCIELCPLPGCRSSGRTSPLHPTRNKPKRGLCRGSDPTAQQHVAEADDYAPSASATAFGLCAAISSRARAGPSGTRRPCSQFCNVATLTPIIRANSACDLPSLRRIDLMSAGRNVKTRAAFILPRLMRPACRILLTRFRKSLSFT